MINIFSYLKISNIMILFLIAIFLSTCFGNQTQNDSLAFDTQLKTIEIDGFTRQYYIYYPKKKIPDPQKIPLLVLLHGRFGTAKLMMEGYNMIPIAKREGFAIVFPNGYNRSWADGRGGTPADKEGINDVKFIEAMIHSVLKSYSIDPAKVFIAGHSNGGFMTQRMLMEKTNLFRAGVSIAAYISKNVLVRSSPTKPISVAFFSGTEDPLVPYEGGFVVDGEEILGADDSVNRWVNWNECQKIPLVQSLDEKKDDTKLDIYSYQNCKENVRVKLYKIWNGGHMWPGLQQKIPFVNLGKTTEELNASEELWKFFKEEIRE